MHRKTAGLVAALALSLGVTACGDDDDEPAGNASAPAAAEAPASSDLAAVKAQVAKDQQVPASFPGPEAGFDPGKKRAMVIACGFQAPVCATAAKEGNAAFKAMGWEPTEPQDGKLAPQTQSGLINKAVQQDFDAIVMYGIDANSIKAAVERAAAADIPIGCIVCDSGAMRGKVIDATPDFTEQGKQIARYLIAKNEGKAKVVAFQDNAFPQTTLRTTGLKETIEEQCPDCEFEAKQQSVAETAQPGPPSFTALLSANRAGSLTDVVALYDGIGIPMATTLKSRGRKDPIVSGYDAEKVVLQGLQSGDLPYGATIGSPVSYATWSAVDLVARKAAGAELWDATKLPAVTITKDNAGDFVDGEVEPSGDWRAEFQKRWGGA